MVVYCNELEIIKSFYDETESEYFYRRLVNEQEWPDNRYAVAGRVFELPRLQTWHADPGIRYSYTNNLLVTRPWSSLLLAIKTKVEAYTAYQFNSVLVNYYRNGRDYVGWHADNELELGAKPFIASVSFGATRRFCYKSKTSNDMGQLLLSSGSLLIMHPDFQHEWLHSIPAETLLSTGRVNLTFRRVEMPIKT